jgi:hypothetical protein
LGWFYRWVSGVVRTNIAGHLRVGLELMAKSHDGRL